MLFIGHPSLPVQIPEVEGVCGEEAYFIDKSVAIEEAEAGLKASNVPRLSKVLPQKKVARYLQIENKIRAVMKYGLAEGVPLVQERWLPLGLQVTISC